MWRIYLDFWKSLAHNPALLRRVWDDLRSVMAAGALDAVTKEMIYIAVSVANGCEYCIHSHTANARAKGMTEEQHRELLAVIGTASQTNALVAALGTPLDAKFDAEAQ